MLKKILMREEVAKKKKRNQILVGGVLIVLMVVSTLGYSLMDGGNDTGDNVSEFGIDFVRDGGFWKTVIGGVTFGFQYLPSEVENISVNGSYDFGDYNGKVLYFVNENEGASEILSNLGRYVLRYQESCLRQDSGRSLVAGRWSEDMDNVTVCEGDLPSKNCDDNLIIFGTGNETVVWKNESCVYIVGDGVRGADAFLYKALKIT